jgi:hypothetical protein
MLSRARSKNVMNANARDESAEYHTRDKAGWLAVGLLDSHDREVKGKKEKQRKTSMACIICFMLHASCSFFGLRAWGLYLSSVVSCRHIHS